MLTPCFIPACLIPRCSPSFQFVWCFCTRPHAPTRVLRPPPCPSPSLLFPTEVARLLPFCPRLNCLSRPPLAPPLGGPVPSPLPLFLLSNVPASFLVEAFPTNLRNHVFLTPPLIRHTPPEPNRVGIFTIPVCVHKKATLVGSSFLPVNYADLWPSSAAPAAICPSLPSPPDLSVLNNRPANPPSSTLVIEPSGLCSYSCVRSNFGSRTCSES